MAPIKAAPITRDVAGRPNTAAPIKKCAGVFTTSPCPKPPNFGGQNRQCPLKNLGVIQVLARLKRGGFHDAPIYAHYG